MTPAWNRHRLRLAGLFGLLCSLAMALVGFSGYPQSEQPTTTEEPTFVGPVANLVASTEGQAVGAVRLTWTAAENAQVHFVIYLKSEDLTARNYTDVRVVPFGDSEGVISGLESGTSYHFIVRGMRFNFIKYAEVWGNWSQWASATPPSSSVATDRAALIAFYNATDGPNWTDNSNWLSDAPIGAWHGVTTNPNGRVIGLDFFIPNQLTGVIPPELGGLTNLTSLRIRHNQLTGAIPQELGNLTNLEELDLSGNRLTGAIPPELGDLTNLEELDLSGNRLTGTIPPELGRLANLEYLSLSSNQLTGTIPPELGRLTNLTWLGLSGNQLTGVIPPELGNLTSLDRMLDLYRNQLTGAIPPELGNLTNLTRLDLGENQLTGAIPPELGNLTSLEDLRLSRNRLMDAIPSELGRLANLESLRIRGNRLTGCQPSDWRYVIYNDLADLEMPFCDPAPTRLPSTDRAALVAFYNATGGPGWEVSYNWLSDAPLGFWYGVTVDRNGRVIKLFEDTVWGTGRVQLTGVIPPELGNLTNLTVLHLRGHQLAGAIPPELGNLANLEELHLYQNQLTGAIPPECGFSGSLGRRFSRTSGHPGRVAM